MSELTYKEIRADLAKEAFAKAFESELGELEKKAFWPLLIPAAKFLAVNVGIPLAINWGLGKIFGGGGEQAAAPAAPQGTPQWRPGSIAQAPMSQMGRMGFRPQPVTGMAMGGGGRMPGAF